MPNITNLGSFIVVVIICLIILIYGISTKNRKLRNLAIMGLIAIIITDIAISILKIVISEPRPFITLKSVHLLVSENDPFSFPSGHSGNIFALAVSLGLNWTFKIGKKSIKLIWVLIPIAFIIGFSRIYIGVHYPFDVLIGALIGITGGLIATNIGTKYLNNHEKTHALKKIYTKYVKKIHDKDKAEK
jgi:undecaprenyl-diphosphatase